MTSLWASKALIWWRNWVWNVRVRIKKDPFESGTRQCCFCGTVAYTLGQIKAVLLNNGYVLNDFGQYEDEDQILSGHYYMGNRQVHVRVFENGAYYDLYAHEEYNWQTDPIKHIRGVDLVTGCPYIRNIFTYLTNT